MMRTNLIVGLPLTRPRRSALLSQDMRADLVVVPHVAWPELKIPVHAPGVGIPRDHTIGVEVVARPIERIEHRYRIAGSPEGLVGDGIVGPRYPHRAAAGAPSIGVAFPGRARLDRWSRCCDRQASVA